MTLANWLNSGWLKAHATSAAEVKALLEKVERDIAEAGKSEISADWRLAIAYNACLGCATVAMRASGYRAPEGDGHHYRTIESLRFALRAESGLISTLHAFRKKRSIVSYDAAGTVSETEVAEVLKLARELLKRLQRWLEAHHPELL
jgi:hypothetical protein